MEAKQITIGRYLVSTLISVEIACLFAGIGFAYYLDLWTTAGIIKVVLGFLVIGALISGATAFKNFNLFMRPLNNIAVLASDLSSNNLSKALPIDTVKHQKEICHQFEQARQHLNHTIKQFSDSALEITSVTNSIEEESAQVLDLSSETDESLSHVALKIVEETKRIKSAQQASKNLGDQIKSIHDAFLKIETAVEETVSVTKAGDQDTKELRALTDDNTQMLTKVNASVDALSQRIGDINNLVDAITAISDQTNLLSLNASIEAARAGEHGRGFAVVAEEIKKLSEQSKESAERITENISAIVSNAQATVNSLKAMTEKSQTQNQFTLRYGDLFNSISQSVNAIGHQMYAIDGALKDVNHLKDSLIIDIDEITTIADFTQQATLEVQGRSEKQIESVEVVQKDIEALKNITRTLESAVQQFKL